MSDDNIDWNKHWNEIQTGRIDMILDGRYNFDYFRYLLPERFDILELGCGVGLWTSAWKSVGGKYTGIDASDVAINEARSYHPESRYELINVENFDFNNEFDVVFTNTFLQHILNEKKESIFERANKALRNNGLMVCQCEKNDVDTITTMSKDRYIELAKRHGFEFVKYYDNFFAFVFRKP
jgi:2-polyprenyl-3-methyl-5-hydroxy-6-metoxy-1,4-benzoquinol methylase